MKKLLFSSIFFLSFSFISKAQPAQKGFSRTPGQGQTLASLYGKIVDSKTGKGIEFASVQLNSIKYDSIQETTKNLVIAGQLTEANGDFNLENVPAVGSFSLKIYAIGYEQHEEKITLTGGAGQMKDLGNIKLDEPHVQLKEVEVDGSTPAYELKIDKKVYNVEKNPMSEGGTAEDVLKNIPSVNVDIDNNVTLRNASPQLFVDGRPTTLSIDQIPADAIEQVEVITNPSAKYDASGGMAGILNIVLKKNRKIGYNGNVRAGIDSRARGNLSGDINVRQNKINFFVSGNINQRKSNPKTESERQNLLDTPLTVVSQNGKTSTNGYFSTGRAGLDFFMSNRTTLTLSGMYTHGEFSPHDKIKIQSDTLFPAGTLSGLSKRNSTNERNFSNSGATISFKHLFPKEGREWTADVNYNDGKSTNSGIYETQDYLSSGDAYGNSTRQQQKGNSLNRFITSQTDFVNPISGNMKIETGIRAAIRSYESSNENYNFDDSTDEFIFIAAQSDKYKFTDQVYAAYLTFSNQVNKIGYQLGLRAESSLYNGEQLTTSTEFENSYPLSLFPSGFLSYKFNDKNDLQLSYTRRINRPNFFQLIPYTDYTDSLNLSRGNAGLKPEFTNSLEFSWQKSMSKKNSLLSSLYFKNSTDLITRYQLLEFDSVFNKDVVISTFENANSSYAYGLEVTLQNSLTSWLDATVNVNAYNSFIDGKNIETNLDVSQFSWFTKINLSMKLAKNLSFQVTGDYQSQTSMQVNSGISLRVGGGGMGGGYGGGPTSTAQGFVRPNYGLDAALKYEFLKNKSGSLTLGVSDLFKTRKNDVHSESAYFIQDTLRTRDRQVFRLNFSYRFGKFDSALFKRKNTKENTDNNIDMGM